MYLPWTLLYTTQAPARLNSAAELFAPHQDKSRHVAPVLLSGACEHGRLRRTGAHGRDRSQHDGATCCQIILGHACHEDILKHTDD